MDKVSKLSTDQNKSKRICDVYFAQNFSSSETREESQWKNISQEEGQCCL